MSFRIDNKVALVTGADSGIGRGIAVKFAEAGADVTVTYFTDQEGAEQTAKMITDQGRQAHVAQVDVGNPGAVELLFLQHDEVFGKIDILVNNAGIGGGTYIVDQPFEAWERVIRTNLHGPYLCLQQAARRMLQQGNGGRIINITSVHEEACGPGASAYNSSKAGLRNLTRTAANELGPNGITVNALAPGMILTPMNHIAVHDALYLRAAEEQIVMRRAGLPVDIANMALFLASEEASYCTGATYFVDGGWMLTWPPV